MTKCYVEIYLETFCSTSQHNFSMFVRDVYFLFDDWKGMNKVGIIHIFSPIGKKYE